MWRAVKKGRLSQHCTRCFLRVSLPEERASGRPGPPPGAGHLICRARSDWLGPPPRRALARPFFRHLGRHFICHRARARLRVQRVSKIAHALAHLRGCAKGRRPAAACMCPRFRRRKCWNNTYTHSPSGAEMKEIHRKANERPRRPMRFQSTFWLLLKLLPLSSFRPCSFRRVVLRLRFFSLFSSSWSWVAWWVLAGVDTEGIIFHGASR